MKTTLLSLLLCLPLATLAQVQIESVGGWRQSCYATFSLLDEAASYNVYCRNTDGEYTQIDNPLVRNYGTYGRADAMGLAAGNYQLKVVPVDADGTELTALAAETATIAVTAHDRSGFAFNGGFEPGAYKADGTLKSNTAVVYITEKNKDTAELDVIMSTKGTYTTCTGLQSILDGFKKGCDSRSLCVRIVGQITDPAYTMSGDIVVDMNKKTVCAGITIEGVGCDATADGWGIRVKNATSVEISNLGFVNTDSDEGDNIGLQQDNEYIWVHNCDFFYGEAGSDSDQAKGDGALDCKKTNYVTIAYNHFWDNGKCNLLGLSSESDDMYVTYHHNWYDHSDSRHPRVRYYSCHVYNNYFDGCAKYGVGATCASSIFVERNYYRNTNKPMLISMQGTDIASGVGTFSKENGGMIKAYGNVFAEQSSNFKFVTYADDNTGFDAYVAETADEVVPATVVTKQGGTCYNNFDTDASIMYAYTPDEADNVPAIVTGDLGAGRLQHGDLQWTFDNATDDTSYAVNTALKAAINGYTTSLVGLFTDSDDVIDSTGDDTDDSTDDSTTDTTTDGTTDTDGSSTGGDTTVTGSYECHFTGLTPSSSFYTFTNCNYSNSHGQATVNGTTYTECLKIESKTEVSFTIAESMELTLVFKDDSTPNIKIDGTKYSSSSGNVIAAELEAGTHTLTKASANYLFYMNLSSLSSGISGIYTDTTASGTTYNLLGIPVKETRPGNIYIINGKKFICK